MATKLLWLSALPPAARTAQTGLQAAMFSVSRSLPTAHQSIPSSHTQGPPQPALCPQSVSLDSTARRSSGLRLLLPGAVPVFVGCQASSWKFAIRPLLQRLFSGHVMQAKFGRALNFRR